MNGVRGSDRRQHVGQGDRRVRSGHSDGSLWPMKLWNIRPGRNGDTNLDLTAGFLVVLRDPLTNLRGRDTNDGIRCSVVVGAASENLNSQGSFLDRIGLPGQGVPDDEAQECGEATAVTEVGILQQALDLFRYRSFLDFSKIGGIGRRHIELHGGS